MASFVKRIFLLVTCLACFIHFSATLVLTPGISVPANTAVPPRLELRTFSQNAIRMNILYLALERMQATDRSQLLSFYRISGIHGMNFAWDGDTGGSFPIDYGFCRHFDRLFLPWHRPYLSLYEKTLYDLATQIIAEFPAGTQKNLHLDALKTWRLPYWDWASNSTIPNYLGSSTTVTVTKMRNGALAQVSIPNPLYSYRFPVLNDPNTVIKMDGNRTIQTVRNPIVQANTYVTQATYTNNQMIQWGPNIKSDVRRALSITSDYNRFSNMVDGSDSIESVHGTVHLIIGGDTGHMSIVQFAALDPICFFYHANIDRLFALWQAMNPNSYLTSSTASFPNANTELHPFRRTSTQYWTAALARYVTAFGYTYPELMNATPQRVTAAINGLYGQPPPSSGKRKRDLSCSEEEDPINSDIPQYGSYTSYNEYLVRITISNGAANAPFRVYIFLGEPCTNERDYATDPNVVGFLGIFTPKDLCETHTKLVKGTVALTSAIYKLLNIGVLSDLEPSIIRRYLRKNLKWRIVGDTLNGYDLTGFQIKVVTAEVNVPDNTDQLPIWGQFSSLLKIIS